MAAEIFARLAIYLTQVGVALLLSLLLWNLSRIYQQAYIRSWFVALLAFAAYQLAILLQWLLTDAAVLMQLLQFITVTGSYTFAVFLLRGMMQTRRVAVPLWAMFSAKTLLSVLSIIGLLTVLPFVLFEASAQWRDYFQIYMR